MLEKVRRSLRSERHQYAWISFRIWVYPDDWLPVQVLGDIGNEAVLADHDDYVFWREQEPRQVGTLDDPAAPIDWKRRSYGRHCGELPSMSAFDLFDLATAA